MSRNGPKIPKAMLRKLLTAIIVLAVGAAGAYFKGQPPAGDGQQREAGLPSLETPRIQPDAGADAVLAAFAAGRSDQWLEASGVVTRTLSDDKKGDRHQRFLVRFGDQVTVLIAHNIDLAPRVPLQAGDRVSMRGEYEWTEKGGVIHWTHHDPGGRREGGWISHQGKTYR